MYVCMYVYMYVCMYICMYVCMYVCMQCVLPPPCPCLHRVGVIEWLQNTKPLKEFLLEAMTEEEMKKYQ